MEKFSLKCVDSDDYMIQLAGDKKPDELFDAARGVFDVGLSALNNFESGVWLGQLIEEAKARKVWAIPFVKSIPESYGTLYFFGPYGQVMDRIRNIPDKGE